MSDATHASAGEADDDPLAPHSLSPTELKAILAAERSGVPFLVYRDAERRLCLHHLRAEEGPVFVGRREGAHLTLGWDLEVSGIHAELRCLAGEWTIVDDGLSTNGTFVNRRRVAGRQRLRDGDRVRLGRTKLAYNGALSASHETTSLGAELPNVRLSESQRRVLVALCRPCLSKGDLHAPASNQQISEEVFLGVDTVKMQLRAMFTKFGLNELPQNQKRAGLAELALRTGLVSVRDLE